MDEKDKCYTCEKIEMGEYATLKIGNLIRVITTKITPWNNQTGLIETFQMTEFGPQMKFHGVTDYFNDCKIIKLCPVCHKEINAFNFFKINVREFA